MSKIRRSRVLAAITIALAAVGLLAGCANSVDSSGAPQNAGPAQGEVAPAQDAGGQDSAQQRGESAVAERSIITTTDMSLRSDDTAATVTELEQLVASKGGYIESRYERGENTSAATLVARIPADRHDEFIAEVKPLATVTSISSAEQDVTLTKLDLDARIETLESSVASLKSLLEKATDTASMLEIERELTDRQGELQSLTAQRDELQDDVAMSTVNIEITTPHVSDDNDSAPGFLAGLGLGWDAFLGTLAFLATALGFFLPALVVLALVGVPLWMWWRRRRRARARAVAETSPGHEADSERAQ